MLSTINSWIQDFESQFDFSLIEETPESFVAGFVSNNDHEKYVSGIVDFKGEFNMKNSNQSFTIE